MTFFMFRIHENAELRNKKSHCGQITVEETLHKVLHSEQ